MTEATGTSIGRLIRTAEVHRDVYTDPGIFDLEMERVFARAWIYVGHESQIPRPGQYYSTRIGKEPVIMIRGEDGTINVLYNRCPHKGATVVNQPSGDVGKYIRCPYHAWTFQQDGKLRSVPHKGGYQDTEFDPESPRFSLRRVARVDSVRGFVFASLSDDGPDLNTFLGGVKASIDNLCDRAPEGEVEVAGGVFRVIQSSNWKIFFENLNDTGHPIATHKSSYSAARAYADEKLAGELPFELHIIDGNGAPFSFWEQLKLRSFDYGHSYMSAIFHAPDDPVSVEYRKSLEEAYGQEKAREILSIDRHNTIIYPSCSPHTSFQQLRVIRPLAVDKTLVEIFTLRLKGAPQQFYQRTLTYTNVVNSPSSIVMADDVEVYRRCQEGMKSDGGDWISQHRNVGQDQVSQDDEGGYVSIGTSEMPMRRQFEAWKSYMTDRSGPHES